MLKLGTVRIVPVPSTGAPRLPSQTQLLASMVCLAVPRIYLREGSAHAVTYFIVQTLDPRSCEAHRISTLPRPFASTIATSQQGDLHWIDERCLTEIPAPLVRLCLHHLRHFPAWLQACLLDHATGNPDIWVRPEDRSTGPRHGPHRLPAPTDFLRAAHLLDIGLNGLPTPTEAAGSAAAPSPGSLAPTEVWSPGY